MYRAKSRDLMENYFVYYYAVGIISVFLGAAIALPSSLFLKFRIDHRVFIMLCLACLYLPVAQYLKYQTLHFYVDFSHWIQLLNNICLTGKPVSNNVLFMVPGCLNYFSVHFVPLVYIVALSFKIWPYAQTIVIVNFVIMVSSVIPIYKLAFHESENKKFPLFMVFLFLWHPTFQYTVLYEFEVLRFSIPLILWMLFFWEKKVFISYYGCLLLAVLVREEVGLTIGMFGLYLLFLRKTSFHGLITAFIGFAAFAVITGLIMPSLRGSSSYSHIAAGSFRVVGITPQEILQNLFLHPVVLIKPILDPVKLANIFMLFIPLLFVPFFAPAVLVGAIPSIGIGLLSGSYTHTSYMLYYLSPAVAFIFYAFIKGWPRFIKLLYSLGNKKLRFVETSAEEVGMAAVFAAALIANVFFGPSPISLQFWFASLRPAQFRTQNFHYSVYVANQHHRNLDKVIQLIPMSAVISTQQFIAPRVYNRFGTLIFPALKSADEKIEADYILFDVTNNAMSKSSPAFISESEFRKISNDARHWQPVYVHDNYFLYKNTGKKGIK